MIVCELWFQVGGGGGGGVGGERGREGVWRYDMYYFRSLAATVVDHHASSVVHPASGSGDYLNVWCLVFSLTMHMNLFFVFEFLFAAVILRFP